MLGKQLKKRHWVLLLIFILTVSLCGCGQNKTNKNETQSNDSVIAEQPEDHETESETETESESVEETVMESETESIAETEEEEKTESKADNDNNKAPSGSNNSGNNTRPSNPSTNTPSGNGSGGNNSQPETNAPETEEPETDAPETEAPETDAPETEEPETEEPETDEPETEEPETEEPETEVPETEEPETEEPETETPETEEPALDEKIVAFITHVYTTCLNRTPSKTELSDGAAKIEAGETAAEFIAGVVFGEEFDSKKPCNSCYVKTLFRCFFGREGSEMEVMMLEMSLDPYRGGTKGTVFNDFLSKQEFADFCVQYDIEAGTGDWSGKNAQYTGTCRFCGPTEADATGFITHVYTAALDRAPSADELNTGVARIFEGVNGSTIAMEVISSSEFISKNLCDEHYVDYVFKVMCNRAPSESEKEQRLNLLANGTTRGDVFNGFTLHLDFVAICDSYKISTGDGKGYWGGFDFEPNGACSVCGKSISADSTQE